MYPARLEEGDFRDTVKTGTNKALDAALARLDFFQ